MNTKRLPLILAAFCTFICSLNLVGSNLPHPRTTKAFRQLINENDYVVLFVYRLSQTEIDRAAGPGNKQSERWNDIDRVQRILHDFADNDRYESVVFGYLNTNWGDNESLISTYELSPVQDQLLFFHDGKLRAQVDVDSAVFTARTMRKFLRKAKVEDYVEEALSEKRNEERKAAIERRREEAAERRACRHGHCRIVYEERPRVVVRPYVGWDWGWPRYDYNVRPSVGIGFGFGF